MRTERAMTPRENDNHLSGKFNISPDDARRLRLAERVLHRWAEGECGSSGIYASWCIERDETTGKPYRCVYPHRGPAVASRTPIPDREAGALRRVAKLCKALNLHYYHQTDPRGAALYIATEPMTDSNYSSVGTPV